MGYRLGFHAEYTASEELLRYIAELSCAHKAEVWTHSSETKSEYEGCIERHGLSPTRYFEKLGLYDYGGGGFHCVHMTDEDLDIFARRSLFVVTNPGSNSKLASGIARLTEMCEKGIPVAIGTDGPASNNCLDMFREMFLVTGLQKVVCDDPEAVPAMDVLKMATVNGARAMGLTDCDVIAQGKRADLIMIDLMQPNMQPFHSIEKNIVYSGSKQNIKMTMVNGRVLYENGKFMIGEEPAAVYENANRIARRILGE